ncbi:hypothetical protein AMTR_s00010p00228270 [Amborella trichopoda]|uniref:Uncharacterized protein n=2 Tax=Amborella trichopoda TaxID=13333 RepID=W1NFM7_AMBTC|nr:hypothetical protein AMTR_s00010p00228270 [Amborella trichopoda]
MAALQACIRSTRGFISKSLNPRQFTSMLLSVTISKTRTLFAKPNNFLTSSTLSMNKANWIRLYHFCKKQIITPIRRGFQLPLAFFKLVLSLVEGKQIHALVFKTGFEGNVFVANAVMDMYVNIVKSGELESSWRVFVGIIGIAFHGMVYQWV